MDDLAAELQVHRVIVGRAVLLGRSLRARYGSPATSERLDPGSGDAPPIVRDRDYLLGRDGLVFCVIGDVHPPSHYLGFVKYFPDDGGDRKLFGRRYRRIHVVSESPGLLADRPELFVYSPTLGRVITGIPRRDVEAHYSARAGLRAAHRDGQLVAGSQVGRDLLEIISRLVDRGAAEHFGVTGSFLVGCAREHSDIDLVCYGPAGRAAAADLFADGSVIRPYAGDDFAELCQRRARELPGVTMETLVRRESRKLQGLTVGAERHVNCEPLCADGDPSFATAAEPIGEMSVLATITDDGEARTTPAQFRMEVRRVVRSSIDERAVPVERITYLRSYLGTHTAAFCAGDDVVVSGPLLHLHDGDGDGNGDSNGARGVGDGVFGIDATPWEASSAALAGLDQQGT